jgi:hypothetical protein
MALTPTVYKWLLRLTHDEPWRPPNSDKTNVFVTTSGVKLKSSALSDWLNIQWQLYGQEIKTSLPRLTNTVIRKATVTRQREGGSTLEEEANLAVHMTHDKSTADRYYDLERGRLRVISSTKNLRKLWQRAGGDGEGLSSDEEESDHEPLGRSAAGPSAALGAPPGDNESDASDDGILPPTPPKTASTSFTRSKPSPAGARRSGEASDDEEPKGLLSPIKKPIKTWKKIFGEREVKALKLVFGVYIQRRVDDSSLKITQKDVALMLQAEPECCKVLTPYTPQMLCERLRYMVNKGKQEKYGKPPPKKRVKKT